MRFYDLFAYMIEDYINSEIGYIQEDIEIEKYKYHYDTRGQEEDLLFLDNLEWSDIVKISDNIMNHTDLEETINETIQEYLYKYKNETRLKELEEIEQYRYLDKNELRELYSIKKEVEDYE